MVSPSVGPVEPGGTNGGGRAGGREFGGGERKNPRDGSLRFYLQLCAAGTVKLKVALFRGVFFFKKLPTKN